MIKHFYKIQFLYILLFGHIWLGDLTFIVLFFGQNLYFYLFILSEILGEMHRLILILYRWVKNNHTREDI